MISYLFINVLISGWALGINRSIDIPAGHKFYYLILALISWLFPYHLIVFHSNFPVMGETVYTVQNLSVYSDISHAMTPWAPTVIQSIVLLMLMGVMFFIIDVIKLVKKHRHFVRQAEPTEFKSVWLVNDLSGACVSGFWQPKIWINRDLFKQAELPAVLTHERQHIKSGDIYWLLVIGFIHRLFWFNPVVYLLHKKLREVIELRCDEACQKQLDNNEYRQQLAKILLNHQQSKATPLLNEIAQNTQFQIKRIKNLSQEKIMSYKNKFLVTVSFIMIMLLSTFVIAGDDASRQPQLADDEVVVYIAFEVSETFSGLSETSSSQKQTISSLGEWQEVNLDRYVVKFKVSEQRSEESESLYMIDTEVLNSREKVLHSPSLLTKSNKTASIEITAENRTDPSFKLNFTVLKE